MTREPVEARRTAILAATCRVLVERGFAALRIQDVARQLGVSTGLIHYHFASKDQLVEAALRLAGQADLDQLRADVAEAQGAIGKLDAYFQAYCPKGAEPGWLLWIDAWGESLRRPELRRISQELDEASVQVVEDVIGLGVDEGIFTSPDRRAAAWRISALVDGLAVQMCVHDGVVDGITMLEWVRAAAAAELGFDVKAFTRRRAKRVA
jgi:AcrR family transcriptional regulator